MRMGIMSTLIFIFWLAGNVFAADEYWACFQSAGQEYGISADLLWSIAKHESNFKPDAINYNTNGSFDFGIMQINSIHYRTLGRVAWNRLGEPCYNIRVGSWLLSQCIRDYGYSWKAIGCYNSRTPEKSRAYAWGIYRILQNFKVKGSQVAAVRRPTSSDPVLEILGNGGD